MEIRRVGQRSDLENPNRMAPSKGDIGRQREREGRSGKEQYFARMQTSFLGMLPPFLSVVSGYPPPGFKHQPASPSCFIPAWSFRPKKQ